MSVPIPLRVRLRTSRGERDITSEIRDLTFRWTDPGGHASCQVSLSRPLTLTPDEIAYYGQLVVYDARTGLPVWDGRLEDPGRSAGADGQVWDLAAVGGQAHTRDRAFPVIYVDSQLSNWAKAKPVATDLQSAQVSTGEDPAGGLDALTLSFPTGTAVPSGGSNSAYYLGLQATGQELALLDYSWDTGLTSATWEVRAFSSYSTLVRTNAANTSGGGLNAAGVGGAIPFGDNLPIVQFRANAATTTSTSDVTWASIRQLVVRAVTYGKDGNKKTSGYGTDARILASDVVADLLGRALSRFDGAGATITPTSYLIDQLAYPDGVTPDRIIEDLLALEPTYTWRVWERNSAGKFRFEWVQRPTSVRYEADTTFDTYDSQGSSDGLYNAVTVRWRDAKGAVQTTVRTSTVPALTAAGLSRQGQIDLGSDVGSLANAQRAGDQFLAEHQYPPNAGRLRIARPIVDLQTGRMVQPWELRPGLIRLKGVQPRIDALNASARDGVTIFRIVSSEYRASDGAATLELDSYARTTPRLIADLMRNPAPTRRR